MRQKQENILLSKLNTSCRKTSVLILLCILCHVTFRTKDRHDFTVLIDSYCVHQIRSPFDVLVVDGILRCDLSSDVNNTRRRW